MKENRFFEIEGQNEVERNLQNMEAPSNNGNFGEVPAYRKENEDMNNTLLKEIAKEFNEYMEGLQINGILNDISSEIEKINHEVTFTSNYDNMMVGSKEYTPMTRFDNLEGVNVAEIKEKMDVRRYNTRMDAMRREIASHSVTTLTSAEVAKLEKLKAIDEAWNNFIASHPSLTREIKKAEEIVSRETFSGKLSIIGVVMQAYDMTYHEACDYLGEKYDNYGKYTIPCIERRFEKVYLEDISTNEEGLLMWYENDLFSLYAKSCLKYLEKAGRRTSETAQRIIECNYRDLLFEDCVGAITEEVMSWHCTDEGVYNPTGNDYKNHYEVVNGWVFWKCFKTRKTEKKESRDIPFYFKLVNAIERCFTQYANVHINFDYFDEVNEKLDNKVNDVIDATFASSSHMEYEEIESIDVFKHFKTYVLKYYPKFEDLFEFLNLDNMGFTYKEIDLYTKGRINVRRCNYLVSKFNSLIVSFAKEEEMKETRRKQDIVDKRKATIEERALARAKAIEAKNA